MAVFMLETLKLSKTLKSSRDDFNVGESLTSESLCDAQTELPKPVFTFFFPSLLHASEVLRTVHFALNFG